MWPTCVSLKTKRSRVFVSDIQVCGTHEREGLVNATITSNAEEEEVESQVIKLCQLFLVLGTNRAYSVQLPGSLLRFVYRGKCLHVYLSTSLSGHSLQLGAIGLAAMLRE